MEGCREWYGLSACRVVRKELNISEECTIAQWPGLKSGVTYCVRSEKLQEFDVIMCR
jgi:hypothetical protein